MIKHVLKCCGVSLAMAVSLGLIHAASVMRTASPIILWQTGAVQISLIVSFGISLFMTPVVVWALTPSRSIKWLVVLWLMLASFVVLATPKSMFFGFWGSIVIGFFGLTSIGIMARREHCSTN